MGAPTLATLAPALLCRGLAGGQAESLTAWPRCRLSSVSNGGVSCRRVHPLAVKAVFAGVAVEQEVFDRVFVAPNQLIGTRYTRDDFSDVHILDNIKLKYN